MLWRIGLLTSSTMAPLSQIFLSAIAAICAHVQTVRISGKEHRMKMLWIWCKKVARILGIVIGHANILKRFCEVKIIHKPRYQIKRLKQSMITIDREAYRKRCLVNLMV